MTMIVILADVKDGDLANDDEPTGLTPDGFAKVCELLQPWFSVYEIERTDG